MTPLEIKAELRALQKDVGVNAYSSLRIAADHGKPVSVCLYPFGLTRSSEGYLSIEADTFREALDSIRAAWDNFRDEHKVKTIRKMALAIIRLTTELGECTDAALRSEFDPGAVVRWGEEACAVANEMAGKGPFSIVTMKGANAA